MAVVDVMTLTHRALADVELIGEARWCECVGDTRIALRSVSFVERAQSRWTVGRSVAVKYDDGSYDGVVSRYNERYNGFLVDDLDGAVEILALSMPLAGDTECAKSKTATTTRAYTVHAHCCLKVALELCIYIFSIS